MTHELKTWPEYFNKIVTGEKPFELRKNDRHFQENDLLILQEWDSISHYSGREVHAIVTYVFRGPMGLAPGYCILGIKFI